MFFDTHVHFDSFIEDGTLPEILERATELKVLQMLAVGGSVSANAASLQLATDHPGQLFGSVAYDRDLAGTELDFDLLRQQAECAECVAIGETGLDYFYWKDRAEEQQKLFGQCMEIANAVQKPIIVHTRDSDDDTLGMLTDYAKVWGGDPSRLGVLHCFTRDKKMVEALLDLGLYISFSGIVTFNNADELRDVAKYVPLDRLVIETDSPYLAPIPHRGKRNEPGFVPDVAKRLAEVQGTDVESIAAAATANARNLFGI